MDRRGLMKEVRTFQSVVMRFAADAVRDSTLPWPTVLANDEGVRGVLEPGLYTPVVIEAAVCDADEHLVIDNIRLIQQCPSGRPASELYSISVLSLLRGTVPSRTSDYVSSMPLVRGSRNVGSIRVRLSSVLTFPAPLFGLRLLAAPFDANHRRRRQITSSAERTSGSLDRFRRPAQCQRRRADAT